MIIFYGPVYGHIRKQNSSQNSKILKLEKQMNF